MEPDRARAEALVAAGAYAEAARELERLGELERAQSLYERVWDFARAAEVAQTRGDRVALLRLLLEAKEYERAAAVGEQIAHGTPIEQSRAAEVYERKRMWAEAAALREATGARAEARELYQRAQLVLEVARLEEAMGREREAGMLYERYLAEEPDAPDAPRADVALGRILGAFGRHDDAARHLQRALRRLDEDPARTPNGPALATRARHILVGELAALDLRDAAELVLAELRALTADAEPRYANLDAYLHAIAERRRSASASSPGPLDGGGDLLGGRYRVVRLLGSGGMGRVYLARDLLAGRDVAVKVVAAPVDARARESYQRFLREARIVSTLRHANIVATTAFHEELGLLVMEYMAGGTLAERLAPRLPPEAARAILVELAHALETAHAHGVVHRDLKPANVFFAASGEAKLGDFGVAHLQDLGATQTGGFIGTLAYMSPEQITGAPLTFACDIYALGVTAYQMLTGQLPFPGPDFVGQHLGQEPPRPSLVDGRLAAWDPLVERMLAKDPAERFGGIDELRRALEALPLGERGRTPLVLPRATEAARQGALAVESADPLGALDAADERYAIEAELGETAHGRLARGVDKRLGRPVVIERFAQPTLDAPEGARQLAWLRAMARHGGPHLQRLLRLERVSAPATAATAATSATAGASEPAGLRAIYEAPVGPLVESLLRPGEPLERRRALAIVLSAARALVGPHAEGVAHGSVLRALVVEESGATLLVAGQSAPPADRSVADDVAALAALYAKLTDGSPPPADTLRDAASIARWARAALAALDGADG